MTDLAETSLRAYRKKIEDGSINTDRAKVFQLIDDKGPITMKALEPFMDKNKHTFSGRVKELKDAGMVEQVGTMDGHQLLDVDSRYVTLEEAGEFEEPDDLIIEKEGDTVSSRDEQSEEVIWSA
jgi:hypothetical protein